MNRFTRLAALALLLLPVAPARAEENCQAPTARWQSREAVRQMARARGWKVTRLKIEDGCYEIHGLDAAGRRFEAEIDPVTLAVLGIEHGGHRPRHARPDHD